MDTPLTLDEIRVAVSDLTGALLEHRALTDHQWDRAMATLLAAREQHGGRIRHLIHVILNVGHNTAPAGALPDALSELQCHLALADDPPPPPPPPPPCRDGAAAEPLRRRRRRAVPNAQLRLFDLDGRS